MKKLLLILCCTLIVVPVFSQPDKPRNWAKITTMKIKGKYDKRTARIFTQKGAPHWKEISLKNYDAADLNTIELSLLDKYTDVVVTRIYKAYFIFNDDRIGISSITGEELVPPIDGKIRTVGKLCIVGEQTSDFDILTEYFNKQDMNNKYKIAYSAGLSKCVLKSTPNGMQVIIPYGKYDFISIVPKGLIGVRGLYVCKIDNDGNKLWGVCDNDGKEIIACKYRSIYFDGQSFVGDNAHAMEELQQRYDEDIQLRQELMQRRRQQWAAALNTFGQAMQITGQAMQAAGVGGGSSDDNGTSGTESNGSASGDYRQRYAHWERMAQRHFESLTNIGASAETKTAAGGVTGGTGHLSSNNYTQMKKALREAQNQMASIRRKASAAGVDIPQSKWETAVVNY